MKKVLLSVLAAFSLAANAQTDIAVTAVLPADGYEFNTTDTNVFAFQVTNVGTTDLASTDTIYFRPSIDNFVLAPTVDTFYPAIRQDDPTTSVQSVLAQDSSFVYAFAFDPFQSSLVDSLTNHIVCYDVLLWEGSTGFLTEDDMTNNSSCTAGIENIGVNEVSNTVFSTYPNPVVNELNIDFTAEKGLVTVFEMTGRQITSVRLTEGTNTIDVSTLAKGNYMFIITNEGSHLGTGKFQK